MVNLVLVGWWLEVAKSDSREMLLRDETGAVENCCFGCTLLIERSVRGTHSLQPKYVKWPQRKCSRCLQDLRAPLTF